MPVDSGSLVESTGTAAPRPNPPPGWSNDPHALAIENCWQGRDGDLKEDLETSYDLKDPQPICSLDFCFGEIKFLFQSGTDYYIWEAIPDMVYRIKEPRKLEDIYTRIAGGRSFLKLEVVRPKGYWGTGGKM